MHKFSKFKKGHPNLAKIVGWFLNILLFLVIFIIILLPALTNILEVLILAFAFLFFAFQITNGWGKLEDKEKTTLSAQLLSLLIAFSALYASSQQNSKQEICQHIINTGEEALELLSSSTYTLQNELGLPDYDYDTKGGAQTLKIPNNLYENYNEYSKQINLLNIKIETLYRRVNPILDQSGALIISLNQHLKNDERLLLSYGEPIQNYHDFLWRNVTKSEHDLKMKIYSEMSKAGCSRAARDPNLFDLIEIINRRK